MSSISRNESQLFNSCSFILRFLITLFSIRQNSTGHTWKNVKFYMSGDLMKAVNHKFSESALRWSLSFFTYTSSVNI